MMAPTLKTSCVTSSETSKTERNIIKYSVMKHRILLPIALGLLAFVAHAQQGLSVNSLFQGKVVPRENMVEVRVKGRAISKYGLEFYRSVRFNATEQQWKTVDELVERDGKTATGTEQTKRNGTVTLIMTLPRQGDLYRYLCYLTLRKGRTAVLTVVYMEGKVASVAELRKLIH